MKRLSVVVISFVTLVAGCAQEPTTFGLARDQGHEARGTAHTWQGLEGPLTDMMIPERTRNGLARRDSKTFGEQREQAGAKRGLGFRHQSQRILKDRMGTVEDMPQISDHPHMKQRQLQVGVQEVQTREQAIKQRLLNLESVHNVYVLSNGHSLIIGVDAAESNRKKLHRTISETIDDLVDLNRVTITTKRAHLQRMRTFEEGYHLGQPIEAVEGFWGEMVERFNQDQS
ncbi:YhcN/YlaJ family sporulation lipoprotein [Halalkalibacterium halodurans]|uniref:YhcN/YlaJ family sporulation lipoprotein n=1 Tax=Halalkalibacterium halodurans TaxID=86665 RepID=UPI002AA9CCD6|nr:YhcN/YlaJ family sporulation lipoprotein [Halalkalibacterium halodurans]MDY7222312.1 YhcN/YlaJ family sporulation lipoprotein [Halalkalibacterium halodurans]MDY7241533.1 YhcN/YlaJ family sporulation lipoprotein [Halalkalibacterium halodurans]